MSIREDTSRVLDARFLVLDGSDPLAGFPMLAPDGALATPSYAFELNTTTGLSLVADNLVFGAGGTGSLVVGMDGNVAVGGAPPTNYGVTTPGEGVLFVHEVTTPPTTMSGGAGVYVSGTALNFINSDAAIITLTSKTGDVTGPGPVALNAVASFNGVTGSVIQDTILLATDTNTLLGPDGSGANNLYSFTGDPNTGMFYAAGALNLSSGGTGRVQIGSSTVSMAVECLVPDGAVGAPAYTFTTAPTSGLFVNGSDVHVSCVGVTTLTVDDVGGAVPNTSLAAPPTDYGAGTSGVGVVFVPEAAVDPSGLPNSGTGAVLYVSGDSFNVLTSTGVTRDLTKCIEEASGTTTLNGVVRFDGTTGRLVQDTSTLTVDAAGQWAGATGAAAGATYGFTGDIDTGMFRSGAGVVDLTTNSTTRLAVSASSVNVVPEMLIPDGTAALPGLAFTSTPSSGIYLDTSASVAASSSGQESIAWFENHNTVVCGAATDAFGGGDGVVWLRAASTVPVSNPSDGGLLYASGTELLYRTPSGSVFTMTGTVAGPGSATDEALVLFDGTSGELVQNGVSIGTDAGQVRAGDGLLAAPAYSFTSDPDTGMYISGTDVFLTSGGVGQLGVDGSVVTLATPLALPPGSVSTPGLAFTGDPDTGIFTGLANQFSVGVGGSTGLTTLGVGASSNVSLSGGIHFAGGEGVVYLEQAAVVPVGALTSGALLYVSGNNLVHHDDAGATRTLNASPTAFLSGPTSSAVSQVAFWDSTDGTSFDAAGSVTTTATQFTATEFRAAAGTGITDNTSRLAFTADTVPTLLVGTGGVEVSVPFHADADVRLDGASGALESVSGAAFTTNNLNAAGTYEWQRDGTTIFTLDSSLNLSTANSILFPSATESLSMASTDGTTYTIASTSTGTPDDIIFQRGSSTVRLTASHTLLGDAMFMDASSEVKLTSGAYVQMGDGSIAAPAYTFDIRPDSGLTYDSATSSVGWVAGGALGVAVSPGPVSGANVAFCVATYPTTYNGGDNVVYIGEVITLPGTNTGSSTLMFVSSDDDLRYIHDINTPNDNSTLNALARRARVTLAAQTVSDSTSDNLDGNTWVVDGSSAGVSGTTTGALTIPSTQTTVMVVVEATWVSDATGYRRVSITTGVGHTTEATTTTAAVSGAATVQTVTLVRRLESGDASLQFAAQVFQNSGGNLDVDMVMTMVRLN